MKINERYTLTLPKPSTDGIFECTIQKKRVFIRDGIENEKVEIQIIKQIKEGFIGKIAKVLTPSKNRILSKCPYSECGGCTYNHMSYDSQCELKQNQIKELFKNEKMKIHPLIQAENPRAYRNKSIFTFQKKHKNVNFGFYQENSHYVQDIQTCMNHDEITNQIFKVIKQLVIKFKMDIFDEDNKNGIMRHVLIRRAVKKNQTLVCLVVSQDFKGSRNFASELVKKIPQITTVVLNINPRKTSVVLSNQEKVLYGKGFIVDELCGKTYKLSANTFYQINHDQTEKLYSKAIELCQLKPTDTVLDMYCGIGTIGMSCANQVQSVIGVEINPQSVIDAKNNAKMNHVNNISFVSKDASAFMKKYASKKKKVDIVIMDPPRSGSDETFITSCVSMNPKKVLYISCNPVTQLRDLQLFKHFGYSSKKLYLFDLFPYSSHVETVCLMSRKDK